MSILVIDVGTSGVRSAVVNTDGTLRFDVRQANLPDSPMPGLVEFDATIMWEAARATALSALAQADDVSAIGVTNQRASVIAWDRATGVPTGPGLGWQDLRTLGDCLVWQAEGHRFSPNGSSTKIAHLLADAGAGDFCVGTVDSWLIWNLTDGRNHVIDSSNAGVTELTELTAATWNPDVCATLGIPLAALPTIVDSIGVVGEASALPGSLPIAGIAGDQQASLIGQGCVTSGAAKITFGTGAMLDVCVGTTRPSFDKQSDNGTFPIVAWSGNNETVWGVEAVMLAAGTNVEWLVEDMGLIASPGESHDVAASVDTTDGVIYVPALMGLGTPHWDFGARGTLLGLTRGSTKAHITRAVLEGVANRGADLVEAAEADTGLTLATLRVDGGMSVNPTFVQALANATGRTVETAAEAESTTLGAAYLAGVATGVWPDLATAARETSPRSIVDPNAEVDRDKWKDAIGRSGEWYPELSGIKF